MLNILCITPCFAGMADLQSSKSEGRCIVGRADLITLVLEIHQKLLIPSKFLIVQDLNST